MTRVLLLAATNSYRAGAFLAAARRLGFDVTVASDRAQALAAANPLGHLTLDFIDVERASAAIEDFARRAPIDAVVAADDDGVVLAAAAAQRLGLRHASVEAARAARDKLRMREGLARAGFAEPWFVAVPLEGDPAAAARRVPYPCVLKPTQLSASRGVIRADDAWAFERAFHRIVRLLSVERRGGPVLVESFLPGAEVALEGVIERGRLRVLAVFDKPDPLDGPFFEETLYVTPSRLGPAAAAAVAETTARAAGALGLDDGPVHAELRWDGRRAAVVEIAPRSIGGLCSRALRFGDATLEEVLLRHAAGQPLDDVQREPRAAGVSMIPIPRGGRLAAVRGQERAQAVAGIEEVRITVPVGDRLVPLPEGARYLGFVFARAESPEEVEAALREAHRRLEFDIEDDRHAPTGAAHHGDPPPA